MRTVHAEFTRHLGHRALHAEQEGRGEVIAAKSVGGDADECGGAPAGEARIREYPVRRHSQSPGGNPGTGVLTQQVSPSFPEAAANILMQCNITGKFKGPT